MKLSRVFGSLALGLSICAAAYAKDMIDNPEYKYWSSCKAGSWVTMHTVSDMNGNKSENETTHKLLEISPEKATIETKMSMMVNGKPMDMPASKRDIAAKVEKADGGEAKGEKPKEGDEEVEVGGKKIKCHWVESHSDANGMKTDTKVWMSDEVPGHMAKMESKMDGSVKGTTTMTATKWEKK